MDISRFHNETMGKGLSLKEVTHLIKSQLIIDFYELDDSKYGLILIKDGKYLQYAVAYENIINGSFINVGPLEDYVHIYVCPDGELYNVSFERVLNYSNISYLSSVQTLFKKNTDDDSTDQLVSFVYPDFSGRLSDDNDRGEKKEYSMGHILKVFLFMISMVNRLLCIVQFKLTTITSLEQKDREYFMYPLMVTI